MTDGALLMDRYLVHECPAWSVDEDNMLTLPPEDAVNIPRMFLRWRCEFCGFDEVER